ncbi:MAG TPA: phosphate transport system regulatory protein PhoU [Syntrophus sp. (in: bacteria)]|jgi:phosphate transport system protein|nr:phosphate transport system regulatory protein PhoU [Syntrophus sp. (in: bacteria)]
MDTKRHTSKQYEAELLEVKENLLYLGALVQEAIADSIQALLERNTELARKVIANDVNIDKIDDEVEDKCIRLLALRQPAARDLRFITTAIKINGHLERIGDMAVKICEKIAILNEEPQLKPYIDLPRMADIARSMIRESLDALVNEDVELANKVRREDEFVDSLNEQIFRELLTFMMEDPRTIHRSLLIMQISKTVERISDHAKSIADMVVFMITGKNVRHEWPFEVQET